MVLYTNIIFALRMKKVLIITYYWPPSGGSGVQRWLKFVKYFNEFGIEPIIYTVDNPDYAIIDKTLKQDIPEGTIILKQPIWEPYKMASFLSKKKGKSASTGFLTKKKTIGGTISKYVRANYFIPDARKFWIKPSVKFLNKYLAENKVDAIVSSGPPHSLHLIALELKKKFGLPWLSDFRDPWTDIDYLHRLPLSERSKRKHLKLEKEVLNQSNAIVVVGETMRKKYLSENANTLVITNGYDQITNNLNVVKDEQFTITHIGLMNEDRNPTNLWLVLSKLISDNSEFKKDLKIRLIGKVSDLVISEINKHGLSDNFEMITYLPHDEVIAYQEKTQVLLLAVNNVASAKGIITGKIFEYLMAKRPIIAIAPVDGDLAEILNETNAGSVVGFNDSTNLKKYITELYSSYKSGNLEIDSNNIEQFHRKKLTEKMANVLKRIS